MYFTEYKGLWWHCCWDAHTGAQGRKGAMKTLPPLRCYHRESVLLRKDSGYCASVSFTAVLSIFHMPKLDCLLRSVSVGKMLLVCLRAAELCLGKI